MSQYFEEDMRIGDSFYIKIQYDTGTNLTGFYHTFSMSSTLGGAPDLSVSSLFGSNPSDEAGGVNAHIRIPPENTALLSQGRYYWDLQVITPDNPADIVTLAPSPENFRDKIRVVPQVTTLSSVPT